MFMFILLSMVLVLSRLHIVGDKSDWIISSRPPASTIIVKSIHGHILYIESAFYGNLVQPIQRRLLEHPRGIKQAYRDNDYNAIQQTRYQPRNKLDESRFYRSAVEDDEDENENDEEEEEEENNKEIGDKNIDEETAEDEAGNEEMVNEEISEVYDYG